jgi:hypothetical protein
MSSIDKEEFTLTRLGLLQGWFQLLPLELSLFLRVGFGWNGADLTAFHTNRVCAANSLLGR